MAGRWNILILALYSCVLTALSRKACDPGFYFNKTEKKCLDYDDCNDVLSPPRGGCVENATCHNTNGSYYCQCANGFRSSGNSQFKADDSVKCDDINECSEIREPCGPHATCINTIGSYSCGCPNGFIRSNGVDNTGCIDIDECQEEDICGQNAKCNNTQGSYDCICNVGFKMHSGTGNEEKCEDICEIDKTICGNGTCHHGASGHYCACHAGFTNYGINGSRCTALDCDIFEDKNNLVEKSHVAHDIIVQLKKSCVSLTESESPPQLQGEDLLQKLLSLIDEVLSRGPFNDNRKVSTFLDIVENVLGLIGPFIDTPGRKASSDHTEVDLLVFKGAHLPKGAVNISSKHAQLDIQLETAAGDPSYYPGFTTLSLLSYGDLEKSAQGHFDGMEQKKNQSFQINSKVVTVTVSNRNTSYLEEPINIKFYHLKRSNESHICVFWDSSEKGGTWSSRGCKVVESTPEYTVCSSTHLSSFAVLMALYDIENKFELQMISWVGLSLSLVCLFICILTFSFIRSIQSPRTTIHLHLCICLFIAMFMFLVGISRTENRVGCAVVAGLLHFFFLAAFCWMCLEGIQLFRMVVLVFNTSFKTLYMMAGGYGVPAVIVAVTTLVNAKGYGNERYCWLNLDSIWSFFGPVCFIIVVNIFFFLITVWKLAQKFTSLNPDLDSLQKIRAFTITAVAQLCVLGTMWIFGCFQFDKGTIVMSYLFAIFGSFQGVMLFVMHCLFCKQVREEYGNILSRFCAPRRKTYSEFGYSQSSKAHATKSSQDTGESQI